MDYNWNSCGLLTNCQPVIANPTAHLSIIDGISPQRPSWRPHSCAAGPGSRLFPDKSFLICFDLLLEFVGSGFLSVLWNIFCTCSARFLLLTSFFVVWELPSPISQKRPSRLSDVTLHEAVHGVKAPRHLRHQEVDPRRLSRRLMANGMLAASVTHTHTNVYHIHICICVYRYIYIYVYV